MERYFEFLVVLIVAAYTFLYGIDSFKERNYLGFTGITLLSLAITAIPFYILFLKS